MADYFIQHAPILFMVSSPDVEAALVELANELSPQGFSLDIHVWGPGSSTLHVKERRIYEENNGKVYFDRRRGCYIFLSNETIGVWCLDFAVSFKYLL
jgi:hypothetical protein